MRAEKTSEGDGGVLLVAERLRIGSGITIAVLAHAALALQLSADAAAWHIVVISMIGTVGASCMLMPTTTVATRSLEPTAIPSGSTIMGVLNQVSAAIFTAAVSVLLASQLSARLPGIADDGVGSLNALPPDELAVIAPRSPTPSGSPSGSRPP